MASYATTARGACTVSARSPYTARARGACAVSSATAYTARARGACSVAAVFSYTATARGVCKTSVSYTATARGLSAVLRSLRATARGACRVVPAFRQRARGACTVYQRHTPRIRGMCRVANDALERYELYRGVGASPDLTASPYATSPTLPFTTPVLPIPSDNRFVLRFRNRFNLLSQNILEARVRLDDDGLIVATEPRGPRSVVLSPGVGGVVNFYAEYDYDADGAAQADAWVIYLTTNSIDPDPSADTPVVVDMRKADGIAKLTYATDALAAGTVVKAIVRTRRSGTPDVDSTDTDVYVATAETEGPSTPAGSAFLGTVAEQQQ